MNLLRLSRDLLAVKAPLERLRPGQLLHVSASGAPSAKAAVLCPVPQNESSTRGRGLALISNDKRSYA